MREFDVSFHVRLNKLLNKQRRGRWTDITWRSYGVTVGLFHAVITKYVSFACLLVIIQLISKERIYKLKTIEYDFFTITNMSTHTLTNT